MTWFYRWLGRKISRANLSKELEISASTKVSASQSLESTGMNFTLYQAEGGHVLECSRYDRQADRTVRRLYIIEQDQDFAQRVAQCMTMEGLRR